jgi:hypothetical protein
VRRRKLQSAVNVDASDANNRETSYEWVHIDDQTVTRVTDTFVFDSMQAQVYILYYCLVQD